MKELFYSIKKIFDSDDPIFQQIRKFAFFQFCIWLLHLLLISLVSFFHLILHHPLGTIAEWINVNGWQLIMITKVIVFVLFLQFYSLKLELSERLKTFYHNGFQLPRLELFVVCLFFLIAQITLGNPVLNDAFILKIDKILISFLGNILFYGIDLIFVLILNVYFPVLKSKRVKLHVLLSVLFYLGTKASFQYEILNVDKSYLFYFFMLLYLAYWKRENWSFPMFFLVFAYAPLFAFLGFDPIWENQYSLFRKSFAMSSFEVVFLILSVVLFLEYKRRVKIEYIYRD